MNELAIIFDKLNLDTMEIIEAILVLSGILYFLNQVLLVGTVLELIHII